MSIGSTVLLSSFLLYGIADGPYIYPIVYLFCHFQKTGTILKEAVSVLRETYFYILDRLKVP